MAQEIWGGRFFRSAKLLFGLSLVIVSPGRIEAQSPIWMPGPTAQRQSAWQASPQRVNCPAPNYRMAYAGNPAGGYGQQPTMASPAPTTNGWQPGYESWGQSSVPCQSCPQASYGDFGGGYCDVPSQPSYGCDLGCYAGGCAPSCCWAGYVGYLMLDRQPENHRTYSYDSADESYQLLDSRDSNFEWASGVEGHLMCINPCTCCATELVYWGIFPADDYTYAYPSDVTGNLNGIFNFDQLDYNGNPANTYVDNALVHRLHRHTELYNVEVNRIWGTGSAGSLYGCCADCCGGGGCCGGYSGCGGCGAGGCGGWSLRGLVGFRYLRFIDNLQFASDTVDTMFTYAVPELYYDIDCTNDLFGVQFGGLAERFVGASPWSFVFGAKAGVFCNSADAHSRIYGAAGTATINNGPNLGAAWDISSSKESVATIGEVQAGVAYRCASGWCLRGDYRVIGVSGVALPTNQIYQDLRGIQDVGFLSTNGDLILHGFFAGIEKKY